MTNWKKYKLGDLALQEKGAVKSGPFGSNTGSRFFVKTGVPVIRGNNLTSGTEKFIDNGFVFLTEEKATELNCWAVKDDLLFTAAGTIGQVGLLTGKEKYSRYVISNKQIKVTLNKEMINPLFAFYWYSSPEIVDFIKNHNTGSTIPLINLSVVKSLPINLPNYPTQTRIASILSSLDDKIELNRRMNQTLEQMAQTLFNHYFVDVSPSTCKEVALLDIAIILNGGTPKTSVIEYWNGDIFWISAKDVTPNNGTFILETERKITTEGIQNSSAKLLPSFSTVITARGTVGNVCLLSSEMAISQSNYALKSKIDDCNFVLFQIIKQKLDELRRNSYGTVFDTITTNTLRNIKVVIPIPSSILQLENLLKPVYLKVLNNLKENNALSKVRDTLLPKLMSGEIDVFALNGKELIPEDYLTETINS